MLAAGAGHRLRAARVVRPAAAGSRLLLQRRRRRQAAPAQLGRCHSSGASNAVPVLSAQLVVESKCELGESPVWCTETETLFFVDCLGHGKPKFWSYKPLEGTLGVSEVDPLLCSAIGSIGLVEGGGLIMASDCGIQLMHNPHAPDGGTPSWGPFERLAHPLAVEGLVDWAAPTTPSSLRLNDGRVDRQGRFVVGAYHPEHGTFVEEDGSVDPTMPRGRVYRVVRQPPAQPLLASAQRTLSLSSFRLCMGDIARFVMS